MKKNMGDYKEGLVKLFNSFKKRFGLDCEESLDYVDNIFSIASFFLDFLNQKRKTAFRNALRQFSPVSDRYC